MLTVEIKSAIRLAIKSGTPFVAFAQPGSTVAAFFSDISGRIVKTQRRFLVNSWSGGSIDQFVITDTADEYETIECIEDPEVGSDNLSVWTESTSRNDYEQMVNEVLDYLNNHGGKVVMSRTIVGDGRGVDWSEVADKYFDIHAEAFRYIYFTPRHGCWLGASPELLLKVEDEKFKTMALAGTRPVYEHDEPWSGKNIAEQAIVREYIVDRLYDLGLNPHCETTVTLTTGNIQHLCTVITGGLESCTPNELLRALNPTPALAGYPLVSALEQIAINERHPRRCYGGYVAIDDEQIFTAYVNLRCVNFDRERWCMYVGSGIMPDSDVDDEWQETADKSKLLKEIIEGSHR